MISAGQIVVYPAAVILLLLTSLLKDAFSTVERANAGGSAEGDAKP